MISDTITRVEVIDHTNNGHGRDYVKYEVVPFNASFSIQDDGRTLKIFLKENDYD